MDVTLSEILSNHAQEETSKRQPPAREEPALKNLDTAAPDSNVPRACRRIIREAPATLEGEALLRHYAEEVGKLGQEDVMEMRAQVGMFAGHAITLGASDMDAGGPASRGQVWYRVSGDKKPCEALGRYDVEVTDVLFLSLLSTIQFEVLFRDLSADISYQIPDGDGGKLRFRTTIYLDCDHLALNMRAISEEIFPLDTLGFHPAVQKGMMFKHVRDGLTLVTGVTGSGKSTTLDAIIDANNEDVCGHIVIIAKPIEYMHASKKCIVRNREVGKDVRSFKAGIVQALRQDPDIVVIGEMRDPETISSALEVTDSGHKVFSTLHTSSAIETIDRIVAEYPSEEQERIRNRLADVLRCIVSQKLCPKMGGGRVLAKEVLWMTASARAAIKNDNAGEIYQMMWEGGKNGQTTLEQDLFRLARERKITPATAFDFANNKRRLKQLLR